MSEPTAGPAGGTAVATAPAPAPPPLPGAGTWSLTWSGLRTVMMLELRQRVRSTRWVVVLLVWVLAVGALTLLITNAVHTLTVGSTEGLSPADAAEAARRGDQLTGRLVFGLVIFLVLSLGALVTPALTATSINGDRRAGVLATLQVSLLSPAEIVLGRLLAAWGISLVLLGTALPFVLWGYADGGGTPFGRLVVTVLLTAVTLLVICALGLGFSALTARTSSSVVLTYLTVTMLGLGLPIVFGLATTLTQSTDRVTYRNTVYEPPPGDPNGEPTQVRCEVSSQVTTRAHPERVWWVVAPSPYVVVADAAPRPRSTRDGLGEADDPLSAIRVAIRDVRVGPDAVEGSCDNRPEEQAQHERERAAARERAGLTWPFGLAVDLLLGAGAVVVAVRRLRAPADRLAAGVRVG